MSAPTNIAARDRDTWITAKFRDGSTRRYWGDPEEAAYWDEFETRPEPAEPANDDEIPQPSPVGKGIIPQPGRGLETALPRKESRFRPLTLKEMADLPPPEWLIEGLVPQDGLVVLYGEPRAGKSFVALDWGLSVATGVPWLGHEVRSGEVVYIYAEGTRGAYATR